MQVRSICTNFVIMTLTLLLPKFVILKPLISIAAIVTEALGVFCATSQSPHFANGQYLRPQVIVLHADWMHSNVYSLARSYRFLQCVGGAVRSGKSCFVLFVRFLCWSPFNRLHCTVWRTRNWKDIVLSQNSWPSKLCVHAVHTGRPSR